MLLTSLVDSYHRVYYGFGQAYLLMFGMSYGKSPKEVVSYKSGQIDLKIRGYKVKSKSKVDPMKVKYY